MDELDLAGLKYLMPDPVWDYCEVYLTLPLLKTEECQSCF